MKNKYILFLLVSNIVILLILVMKTDFLSRVKAKFSSPEVIVENSEPMKEELLKQAKRLDLDIGKEEFKTLKETRDLCLNIGYIGNDIPNPYHNVSLTIDNKTFDAKIRLKGDFTDHISDPKKWSYKVKIKNGDKVFNMAEFAIQRPETRNGFGEWVFHKMLGYNDILHVYYDFVYVNQNKEDLGLYAIEGRFNDDFFEYHNIEKQPILRLNDNLFFNAKRHFGVVKNKVEDQDYSAYSAVIDAYDTDEIIENGALKKNLEKATSMLEDFRTGKLKVSEVFDIDKLAKFYAIADLFSSYHATQFPNLRFYYNNNSGKLEPIGFDANGLEPVSSLFAEEKSYLYGNDQRFSNRRYEHRINWLLDDEEFVIKYHQYLKMVSSDQFLNAMEDSISSDLNDRNLIAQTLGFDWKVLSENQKVINYKLFPIKGLHGFLNKVSSNKMRLNIINPQYLPIEIISVRTKDKVLGTPVNNIWISSRPYKSPSPIHQVDFILKESVPADQKLRIEYKVPGIDSIYIHKINPWNNQVNIKN